MFLKQKIQNSNSLDIGIHLGTTCCSLSFYSRTKNTAEPLRENGNQSSFPSIVKLKKLKENEVIFITGNKTKNSPSSFSLSNSTRLIGKTYNEFQKIGNIKESFQFEVEKDGNNNCLMVVENPLNSNK